MDKIVNTVVNIVIIEDSFIVFYDFLGRELLKEKHTNQIEMVIRKDNVVMY